MKRNKPPKQEITLMTLLANEATEDSRKLLKKYNKADAKDCADLEVKLAQLYFDTPDKLAIEKDLAEIHPHKNWLLKRTKVEEVEKPEVVEVVKQTSNADGDCGNPNCPVHGKCCGCSSADGIPTNPYFRTEEQRRVIDLRGQEIAKENPILASIPLIGLVAVVGVIFYVLQSNKNKF